MKKLICLLCLLNVATNATATPITVDFNFDYRTLVANPIPAASGSFSYDSSHDGEIISSSELDSFIFNFYGNYNTISQTYDLAFLNSNITYTGTNYWDHFSFDTSLDAFVTTTTTYHQSILGAVTDDLSSGFYIRGPGTAKKVGSYEDNFERDWDTMTINVDRTGVTNSSSGSFSSVPEPSSIALFAAGVFGIGFARRRQSKPL